MRSASAFVGTIRGNSHFLDFVPLLLGTVLHPLFLLPPLGFIAHQLQLHLREVREVFK